MKKLGQSYKLLALILFSIVTLGITFNAAPASSQTLYFCEGVDGSGYAQSPSSVFTINSSGGYLYFLVRLPYELGTKSVSYEIFRVDSYGGESYDNTIYQDTERDWIWFYKQVTFNKAGLYNVYVYDSERNFLTSGQVSIQYK